MDNDKNRFGLPRYIPEDVRREIRSRCKFGCVLCRRGIYTYEHIEPTFPDAKAHSPDAMCCLCWSCHDAVTRGHTSKALVLAAYKHVQAADADQVGMPVGPLDFHQGHAELQIGSISFGGVQTILRYHGTDFIRVKPSTVAGEPGQISAIFTDESGNEIFRIERNEWFGSTEAWDIEVTGPRITVRTGRGKLALQLRLDPPGRIVVERLDMRVQDAHVLATDASYAIGRYVSIDTVEWMHAQLTLLGSRSDGAAFEFASPAELAERVRKATGSVGSEIYVIGGEGAMLIPYGICIGSGCSLAMRELAMGARKVDDMRQVLIGNFGRAPMFIGTGRTT